MAAPANNPFGAPPQQVLHNPFGAPASGGQPTTSFGASDQNLFGAPPAANPFGTPANNPFGAPVSGRAPSPAGNPFGAPSGQNSVFGTPAGSASQSQALSRQPSPSIQNPFVKPAAQNWPSNSFATTQSAGGFGSSPSSFGFGAQPPTGPKGSRGPGTTDANAMARKTKFSGGQASAPNNTGFGGRGQNKGAQGATPFSNAKSTAKKPNGPMAEFSKKFQPGGRNKKSERQERYQPAPRVNGTKKEPTREPTERTKQLSKFAFDYANKLYAQLKKDNINPPQPLAEPGDPNKRGEIDNLKEAYKKYRTRVYASLRKVDLIDDPEKRRKLEDALPFKGICEDMCPEFEQVSRIAEYDVKTEEKETRPDGLTMWPDPSRMVKKFGRSAAGQDAPLPMDVRSVDALRRTTDYLFTDLLQSESNLPSMHNFLWDRTRAVRKDFTFHSQKSAEEMKDMVYCFETITRFHATALHLLCRKGFANEDFDQKQEIEQLGRTILSLMEAYDMCHDKRVVCENEAEFRAYYLLLNAGDPSIAKRIPTWGKEYWFESEEVQTALSLIQVMDDIREPKGPIKPRRPTTLGDTSFTNYFSIVEDPRVSYTMACIAEIHFTTVRQGILKNLVGAYARRRDAPRTITASDLNAMLRFDTDEEAVEFAELHKFEFTDWVPQGKNPVSEPYLRLDNKKQYVPSPRVKQSFSEKLVERKRTTQSLPFVIYNTIFEEPEEKPPSAENSPDGLFVTQTTPFAGTPFGTPLTTTQPIAIPPVTAPTPSPFGFPASTTALTPSLPSTGGPSTARVPSFAQPSSPGISSAFGALSQPTTQAPVPAQKSSFSFLSQPAAPQSTMDLSSPKPSTILGQPAQTGQTITSPFSTVKAPETSSPFSFLNNASSTQTPTPAQPAQQPAPTFSSTPSLFGGTSIPKPSVPSTQTQDAGSTPAKPVEPAPSLLKPGSTPLPGGTLFPSTSLAKPAEQQPAPPPPAIPSISVTPPSLTSQPSTKEVAPPALSQFFGQSPLPSAPTSQKSPLSSLAAPVPAPPTPQPAPAPPKQDLMGDFTKWFVTGDGGLMEQFTEEALRNLLWDVYQDFQLKEAARKRREEDVESWRVAKEHLRYRLRVKYFYRWRNNARTSATKRILREGKEKMRLYREHQRIAVKEQQEAREKAEREARRAAKRQLMEDGRRLSMMVAASRLRRPSVAYSADHSNAEEQLLASGIFAGIRDDPRAFARRVVREAAESAIAIAAADGATSAAESPARSFRFNPYAESELELEPARDSVAASPDSSSVGGKREGWKTRSLRERFGLGDSGRRRNSLSVSGGSVNLNGGLHSSSFRQSLPPGPGSTSSMANNSQHRTTNFTRKKRKSAEEESDDEPGAKRLHHQGVNDTKSEFVRSRHWDLRARGFVPTPDGNWLPEALVKTDARAKAEINTTTSAPQLTTSTTTTATKLRSSKPTPPRPRGRTRRRKGSLDSDPDYIPSSDEEEEAYNNPEPDQLPDSPSLAAEDQSDLRLRLARLKQSRYTPQKHAGYGTRQSVDLGSPAAVQLQPTGALLLGRVSPPHPPFRNDDGVDGQSQKVNNGGKRKRDLGREKETEMEIDGAVDKDQDGMASSGGAKKRLNSHVTVDLAPGREETSAMVENTRRMLRELREVMDRLEGGQG